MDVKKNAENEIEKILQDNELASDKILLPENVFKMPVVTSKENEENLEENLPPKKRKKYHKNIFNKFDWNNVSKRYILYIEIVYFSTLLNACM